MGKITSNVLLAFVAQACAKELTASHSRDPEDSINKLADKLADNLYERMLRTTLPHHREQLESTTLDKLGHLTSPSRPRCLSTVVPAPTRRLGAGSAESSESSVGFFSWVSNLFKDILGFLGLSHKKGKMLFLGLDNAGKTTLMHMLKGGTLRQFAPTMYANSEDLTIGNIKFQAFDLGGHKTARRTWAEYFIAVDGIIFLVDAADRSRFPEVAEELGNVLREPSLSQVPVVVLGNKMDLPMRASEEELRQSLGIPYGNYRPDMTAGKVYAGERPLAVFMCSVAKRVGYADAFRWLGQFLK